jgi:hypothetical protein
MQGTTHHMPASEYTLKTKVFTTSVTDCFLKSVTHGCRNELTQLFRELTQLFSFKRPISMRHVLIGYITHQTVN